LADLFRPLGEGEQETIIKSADFEPLSQELE
jgi:hypothetical protein